MAQVIYLVEALHDELLFLRKRRADIFVAFLQPVLYFGPVLVVFYFNLLALKPQCLDIIGPAGDSAEGQSPAVGKPGQPCIDFLDPPLIGLVERRQRVNGGVMGSDEGALLAHRLQAPVAVQAERQPVQIAFQFTAKVHLPASQVCFKLLVFSNNLKHSMNDHSFLQPALGR